MEKVKINTEYIKLDQFLKWAGVTMSGLEAKELVLQGSVKVNGNIEMQRGKKLRSGDTVESEGKTFIIE